MLTNCTGCTQIIEVSSYTEHKLTQCEKKADFKQCDRCKEAIEADFYEQHVKQQKCPVATNLIRCPLCHKDIGEAESEEKAWRRHLVEEKCPGASVRISTNAKARVSILRARQPPASEVIMEEDDEEDDGETVANGGIDHNSTTMRGKTAGRATNMSLRDSDVNIKEIQKSVATFELPEDEDPVQQND